MQLPGEKPSPNKVRFYDHPQADGKASAEKGRPVHKKVCYVEIRPGAAGLEVKDYVSRPATQAHKTEYKAEYDKYIQARAENPGRPLELLPGVDECVAADLRAVGIHTIEALAEANEKSIALHLAQAARNTDDPELRHTIFEQAEKGALSAIADFAEHIQEAKYYAGIEERGVSGSPGEEVDASGGHRSIQDGPAHSMHPPNLDLEFNFGEIRI